MINYQLILYFHPTLFSKLYLDNLSAIFCHVVKIIVIFIIIIMIFIEPASNKFIFLLNLQKLSK